MPKMANFFRTKLMYTIRYHAQKLELGLYPEKKIIGWYFWDHPNIQN